MKINWGRVFLRGIVTEASGTFFVFALDDKAFAATGKAAGHPKFPALPFILCLAGCIWTMMWLYAAIRPRCGPGPKTAAVAGLALWGIGALVDAMCVLQQPLPLPPGALVVPVAAALPVGIVAASVPGPTRVKVGGMTEGAADAGLPG